MHPPFARHYLKRFPISSPCFSSGSFPPTSSCSVLFLTYIVLSLFLILVPFPAYIVLFLFLFLLVAAHHLQDFLAILLDTLLSEVRNTRQAGHVDRQ